MAFGSSSKFRYSASCLLLLSRHCLVFLWPLPVTMWMLHVPLLVTIKWQGHSTAVLMTPFFMYFRCTRTSLMSLSHSCLLAIKDKSSCLVRLELLSSCSWAMKIVAGHSLEHLPCCGSQRSTVIGLETVSFLLLQQLPLNRRQHI